MTSKRWAFTAALGLMAALGGPASGENGPYVGGSAGQTRVELDLRGVGDAGFRIDDEDFAYKLFFGYDLLGPLAVEGGYRDLGRVTDDTGLVRLTSETDGFDAFLLGKFPIGPVKLFAKGGVISWDTEFSSSAGGGLAIPDVRVSDDGTDFAWGVGVQFELGKLGFRGEYEQFEIDVPDDLTMLSVGVTYSF